jgi:hypothetical protein
MGLWGSKLKKTPLPNVQNGMFKTFFLLAVVFFVQKTEGDSRCSYA